MSTTDYRNQEALNKALNIYRTYMRSFIIFHLKKIPGTNVEDTVINSVSEWRADEIERSLVDRDIKSIIDIDDFPPLVNANWEDAFEGTLNDDKSFRNQLWLIKTCRDQSWAHPPEGDAESEGTRAYLFLIADVLRKIKKPDKQSEVEAIRDELFPDMAERLEKAEKRLKDLESEKSEAEKRLADVASEKKEYEQKNAALSKQVDEKENQRKKLDKQLKRAKAQNDKYKKNIAGTKQRLEESEAAQVDYKNRLETTSKELKGATAQWKETEERLAVSQAGEKGIAARLRAVQNLFIVAAIGEPEVQDVFQSVYPSIETDATVRILDRRGVNKKNYLLALLEQKQPTLIYVQSKEMVDLLLERVLPEKADLIEKHGEQTSEAEETELLEKLENGELIAVVSNTAFSTLTSPHRIEHFVFCHLVPGLDEFFRQCEPAFTLGKNAYLHLIYNSEQDIDGLAQKYPDREALEKLYPELRKLAGTNGNIIRTGSLYSELDMAKLGIETGLAIFEELELIEHNDERIKLLPPAGKKLDASETYCRGERLKNGAAGFQSFQFELSIEQIWEALLKELNVDNEQILEASSVYEAHAFQDAIRDSGAQSDPSTDAVENDSKSDAEVSEAQSDRSTETVDDDNTVDGEDAEMKQPPKSTRADAKVTEDQGKEKKLSIADRFRANTTEKDRNEIAARVVELRINEEGSKPAWKKIRKELGLKEDEFHNVIRPSEGYREAVIERIKKLRAQDGGWEYSGKLEVLTGIELTEEELA